MPSLSPTVTCITVQGLASRFEDHEVVVERLFCRCELFFKRMDKFNRIHSTLLQLELACDS